MFKIPIQNLCFSFEVSYIAILNFIITWQKILYIIESNLPEKHGWTKQIGREAASLILKVVGTGIHTFCLTGLIIAVCVKLLLLLLEHMQSRSDFPTQAVGNYALPMVLPY